MRIDLASRTSKRADASGNDQVAVLKGSDHVLRAAGWKGLAPKDLTAENVDTRNKLGNRRHDLPLAGQCSNDRRTVSRAVTVVLPLLSSRVGIKGDHGTVPVMPDVNDTEPTVDQGRHRCPARRSRFGKPVFERLPPKQSSGPYFETRKRVADSEGVESVPCDGGCRLWADSMRCRGSMDRPGGRIAGLPNEPTRVQLETSDVLFVTLPTELIHASVGDHG